MYITKIEIENIRSIERFDMTFRPYYAGWHVLIGDNGSGKSTIIRSIALALLGPDDARATRENWNNWLSQNNLKGSIKLELNRDSNYDGQVRQGRPKLYETVNNTVFFSRESIEEPVLIQVGNKGKALPINWQSVSGWFSAAYGPFRRFTGGNAEKEKSFYSYPKLGAHLSAFGEDVALTEALTYIRELYVKKLEDRPEGAALDSLIEFINNVDLLPHNTKISRVDSDGVYFVDGNGNTISADQMSDGFRSVLSLTFELIRQLIRTYGQEPVFRQIRKGKMHISLPGVVLIDEVDAHLHPTWQTRIGYWFIKYFPKIQFIVTTHSPLVCRASKNGSIWRLAAPGSNQKSSIVSELERSRLIFGNVLDAYGTEVFGENVSQSDEGQEKATRLATLNMKSFKGTITDIEKDELNLLKAQLPTI